MARPEGLQPHETLFRDAAGALADSGDSPLSHAAHRTIERINSGHIIVAPFDQHVYPTPTDFLLAEHMNARTPTYGPLIALDAMRMIGASPTALRSEVARTVTVADQYPFNGFERKYHEVYNDALDAQTNWLDANQAAEVPFDPRTHQREDLLRAILGEERYFSDLGFEDWQAAIEEFPTDAMHQEELLTLESLKDDKVSFLVMRQRFLVPNHRIATLAIKDEYVNEWTPKKRAEAAAFTLVGQAVYARRPENW